jgi:hypothetical protein
MNGTVDSINILSDVRVLGLLSFSTDAESIFSLSELSCRRDSCGFRTTLDSIAPVRDTAITQPHL